MTTVRALTAVPQTHTAWQATVVDLLHSLGYQHLHVRKSVGRGRRWTTTTNVVGWPDILAWHPTKGFAALELKVGRDTPTPEQSAVLASLARAGARVMVAYPETFDVLVDLLRQDHGPTVAHHSGGGA
jgi:hypothetical protein